MLSKKQKISASEFKAKCLQLMDDVYDKHIRLTITKRGKPVAKLIPIEDDDLPDVYGCMANSITILGDITESIEEKV